MTTPTLALNALSAITIRLLVPWTGVWIADVDYDLDTSGVVPTGAATATIGSATLTGTIDPRGSGRFAAAARARLVGGAGAWDQTVPPRAFHNDGGVSSTTVLQATAAEVGETISDPSPVTLGVDFERTAGPASRVLAGRDWYVGFDGKTVAASRTLALPPSDMEILSWDPITARAEFAADSLVVPGMQLSDSRFDGQKTIRDVEQTFTKDGARGFAWCADGGASRLVSALSSFVREKAGVAYLGPRRYRVVQQNSDGRLQLQIVNKATGLPDILPITAWPGVPGVTSKPKLGSIVLVQFADSDPALPVVTSYGDGTPISVTIDAATVKVGAGTSPVAKGDVLSEWAAHVVTQCAAASPPITIPPLTGASSTKLFTE